MAHRRFGELAVAKGYIRQDQLETGLRRQEELRRAGAAADPIGCILVELGFMTPDEVVSVLESPGHLNKGRSRGISRVTVGSDPTAEDADTRKVSVLE